MAPPSAVVTYIRPDYWDREEDSLPRADVALILEGVERLQAGRVLSFLSRVRFEGRIQDVLAVFSRHLPVVHPDHASCFMQSGLHTRNLHKLHLPPFLYASPKHAFVTLGVDEWNSYKELWWFKATDLVNRYS
jgi:hypothetical protein